MNGDYDGPVLWLHSKARYTIVVRQRGFKGKEFLDIRDYLRGDDLKHTPRGVTIPLDAVGDLAAALAAFAASHPPSDS